MRHRLFAVLLVASTGTFACGGGDDSGGSSGGGGAAGSGAQSSGGGGAPSGGSSGTGGAAGTAGSPSGGGGSPSGGGGSPSGGTGGTGGSSSQSPTLGGCEMFPPGDEWNMDVSGATVDAGWTQKLMTFVNGSTLKLHPDFGGSQYGIPINIVPQNQAMVPITFDSWPSESDPGPYPFPGPSTAKIEGGTPTSCSGDCHVLTLLQGTCKVYEGYACEYTSSWHCANGAVWDLTQLSYGQRTKGWTSADAAGLSVTAGLLRYDEVMAHSVRHAIRFTTACTIDKFVKPATHKAVPGSCDPNDPNAPPMGLRVRMKASFDDASLSAEGKAVTAAFKKYGMIIADNGSNFFFQGELDASWPDALISELKTIPANAFEVVAVPPLE
jgi:hypothetical protein